MLRTPKKVIEVDMETLIGKLLSGPVIVVNLGLKQFGASLEEQGVEVVQVDWIPPAGGDREMMDLLDNLL
jgi:FdrA protein